MILQTLYSVTRQSPVTGLTPPVSHQDRMDQARALIGWYDPPLPSLVTLPCPERASRLSRAVGIKVICSRVEAGTGLANCPAVFLSYFSLWICYEIQPAVVTPYTAVQNVWTISPARNHQFESSFWLKRLAIYM